MEPDSRPSWTARLAGWHGWPIMVAVFALVVASALSLMLRAASEEQDRIYTEVVRTMTLHKGLDRLLQIQTDIETGHRGFVLTEDRRFLEPHLRGEQELASVWSELLADLRPDDAMARELHVLFGISRERAKASNHLVALVEQGRSPEAKLAIASGEGRRLMDRLRLKVQSLKSSNDKQLVQLQQQAADASDRRNEVMNALLAMLGLLLIAAAFGASRKLKAQSDAIHLSDTLYEASIDPTLICDRTGLILRANKAAEKHFGYRRWELEGANAGVLLAEWPDDNAIEKGLRGLIKHKTEQGAVRQLLFRRRDGTRFTGHTAMTPVTDMHEPLVLAVIRPNAITLEAADLPKDRSSAVASVTAFNRRKLDAAITSELGCLSSLPDIGEPS